MGTVQIFQQAENHFARPEIEISRRLVGQQNGWPADQRAGQNHPLLLSAR